METTKQRIKRLKGEIEALKEELRQNEELYGALKAHGYNDCVMGFFSEYFKNPISGDNEAYLEGWNEAFENGLHPTD